MLFYSILFYSNPSNFAEVLNENMNKIDSNSNEIYTLGNFNLSLNDSHILLKRKDVKQQINFK